MKTTLQPASQIPMFDSLESRSMMSATPAAHVGEEHHEPAPLTRPAAATDLHAEVAGQKVTLTWTDNANNEYGYQVVRVSSKGGGQVVVGKLAANSTTFTDAKAPAGQDYYIVRAVNAKGNSEGSPTVSVRVEEVVNVIAPKVLKSAAVSTTSIKLTWSGDFGATGGYKIERRAMGDGNAWSAVGSAAPGVRCFTDTGLTAGTKYCYRITAISVTGKTATSAVLIGMTKASDKPEAHKTEPAPKPAPAPKPETHH